ncbi:putative gustatory receptor 94a isoform X1 [Drosophila bipectinata]|uniref:putative gustatory receptor 94a isoform X1 n=1 Tax=Drosophila bipectinata TaxID=42026 RepID=UPI001C8ABB7D|nr:putative gustatory receptor 94a [Drosophila bipectinata]
MNMSSDSTHRSMVKFLTITLVALMTMFGLLSNRYYSRSRQKFRFSRIYLAYDMFWTVGFTLIYGHQIVREYYQGQINLRDAITLYSYMNITVAVINFITQMMISDHVAKTMSAVPFFETLRKFRLNSKSLYISISTALIKAIGFPFILEVAFILQQRRLHPELSLIWTIYRLFPLVISNLLNNCFYGAMIVVLEVLKALNLRVESVLKEVNILQREEQLKLNTTYYRMQRFCSLADELDNLAIYYKLIYVHAGKYLSPMSLSMILSLICHLLGMTVGFYSLYYAVADTFIGGKPYDGLGSLINLVFLFISLAEITLLTHLCNNLLIATQRTGTLLQDMNLRHADPRFRKSVHDFTLFVTLSRFKIKPLGLYELDMTLIMNVFSTVASFVLILVQADLSQRFRML